MKKLAISMLILLICVFLPCSGDGANKPNIQVVDLAGLEAAIAEQAGKGVLLSFWAIWCPPCLAELPDLMEVAAEFSARGGVVLSVSYDYMIPGITREEALEKMRDFVAEKEIDFPVLIYDAEDYDAINERFDLPGPIPVTLAIDRKGAIVDRYADQADKDRLTAMMQKALGN